MRDPCCSLCARVGSDCIYPLRSKYSRHRRRSSKQAYQAAFSTSASTAVQGNSHFAHPSSHNSSDFMLASHEDCSTSGQHPSPLLDARPHEFDIHALDLMDCTNSGVNSMLWDADFRISGPNDHQDLESRHAEFGANHVERNWLTFISDDHPPILDVGIVPTPSNLPAAGSSNVNDTPSFLVAPEHSNYSHASKVTASTPGSESDISESAPNEKSYSLPIPDVVADALYVHQSSPRIIR
jgi:hypothetical protein